MSERRGVLSVSLSLLEGIFAFPCGCKIVGATIDEQCEVVNFVLDYAALNAVEEGQELPQVKLYTRVEHFPDAPDFRRLITHIEMPE